MKLYIRDEFFGSIVYNSSTAKYFNLNHLQTTNLVQFLIEEKQTPDGVALVALIFEKQSLVGSPISFKRIVNDTVRPDSLSVPLKAFFNITKKCNLFCKHCYNNSGHSNSPELPYVDVEKTLKELEVRGIFKVTVAGGEPLFHTDFDRIVTAWENTDLAISLITNGICVSERRAKRLGNSKNLRSITISLDGVSSADNDPVRGKGAFDKAIRGIKRIRKHYDRSLAVRITLMQSNIKAVHQLPTLLSGLGINEIKVNSVNAYGRAKNATDLLISMDEYLHARDQLLNSATIHGISVEVPAHKYQRDENDQIGLCKAGEETFEIDGDGSVFPCSFSFGRFLAGNVRYTPFNDIFQNLQLHTINNSWCYQCKGRGGKAEKIFGKVPDMVYAIKIGAALLNY